MYVYKCDHVHLILQIKTKVFLCHQIMFRCLMIDEKFPKLLSVSLKDLNFGNCLVPHPRWDNNLFTSTVFGMLGYFPHISLL